MNPPTPDKVRRRILVDMFAKRVNEMVKAEVDLSDRSKHTMVLLGFIVGEPDYFPIIEDRVTRARAELIGGFLLAYDIARGG